MSRIRSKDTNPELILRKALWNNGFRYRINVKSLPGRPDIVFGPKKVAVFVDGEFWHGYNWNEKKQRIKANRAYWIKKIEGNMERDLKNTMKLKQEGWVVLRFWGKEVQAGLNKCLDKIVQVLR